MTDRKELESIIHELYEARAAGDKERTMRAAAPDMSFCLVGSSNLVDTAQRADQQKTLDAGRHSDPAAVNAAIAKLFEHWDMSQMKTTRLYVDGDTVLAHRAGSLRFIPTGKIVETEYIDRFTFKDGKIVDLTEFADTLLIAETMELV